MIKSLMKKYPLIMDIVSIIYNLLHRNNAWRYLGCIKYKGAFLRNVTFNIHGRNNRILIGRKARLRNCKITLQGNNCLLVIGGGSTIVSETFFYLQDDDSKIIVGSDFTMESGHIASTEGETISIGNDCMFSNDIEIRNGDSHSIIKAGTEERTNWAKPVTIGNHVWLTAHVRVLKGSYISNNSIIANSCIVGGGKLETPFSIYGGNPVRILKTGIDWDRNRYKFKR